MTLRKLVCVALLSMTASMANAAFIYQASDATSSSPWDNIFGGTENLINQGGLSATYTSGVTDFDTFTSTTTGFNGNFNNGLGSFAWFGGPVSFDFTYDTLLTVDRFALWNQSGSASVNGFDLYASVSGLFDDLVMLGSFTAAQGGPANVGSFAATNALGIRVVVNSNYGYNNSVRFDEFAVGGTVADVDADPIPEPISLGLLGLGLLAMGARKRQAL